MQSRRAVVDADAMANTYVLRKARLEMLDGRAQDELGLGNHVVQGGLELGPDGAILSFQVEKRNLCHQTSPEGGDLSSRAGTPATTCRAGTSCVTTAPAPTRAPAPIVTPHKMTAPEPIDAPRQTTV